MVQDKKSAAKLNLDNVTQNHTNINHALFELLDGIYQEIVELDLESEMIFVLRNCDNPEQAGHSYPFVHEVDLFCDRKIMIEDAPIAKELLSLQELRKFYNSGQKSKNVKLRVCAKDFIYEWVELSVFCLSNTEDIKKKVLITVRNINDQILMKSIVDRFVYDTCDYFIHLDTKADSYVMFSGTSDGTPLPPSICNSYSTEIIHYARKYVVPEDQDYVIEQMNLDLVVQMLDKNGVHVFYCGVMDPVRGYTRKCLKYLYYDQKNKMVLLIRTDVTDVYLLEKLKNTQLRQALREARTDSLTGIYNRKAVETLIREFLSDCSAQSTGVLFFIDIDNFKQINDTLGHGQGDYVLQFLSQKLKRIAPPHSIFGRFGGDEFIVFCSQLDVDKELEPFATQLCCSLDDIINSRIEEINLSCSVGVALYPQDGTTYEELYKHADQALYISKNGQKKQFTLFS